MSGSSHVNSPSSFAPRSIAVLGGGPMGLAAAYRLLKRGHHVTLFEADDRLGGMTASFDFNGTPLERFYHFVCKPDQPLFDSLKELNISQTMRWVPTSMGFYHKGKVHDWGRPDALLKFPHLSLLTKLKYGLLALSCRKTEDWESLDAINARDWLMKKNGPRGFEVLWKQLFDYKFYEYSDQVSAAWIASRIKRVGLSRKNLFQEELGYIEGGSQTLIDAWENQIRKLGGEIICGAPAQKIEIRYEGDQKVVQGVKTAKGLKEFDQVISTIPLPYLPKIASELSQKELRSIENIDYVGVRCVLVKLKHQLLPHFWTNIADASIELPGLIEYTNLRPLGEHIVYAPFYLPHTHPKFTANEGVLVDEVMSAFQQMNPDFSRNWVKDIHCTRYHLAQTVCPPKFFDSIPAIETSIGGFLMADTSYYYPEDRSISESIGMAEKLVEKALAQTVVRTARDKAAAAG